ncbi:glutathionylspermidine synthase family protein [Bradyrhizobium sp. SZCCHNS3002]|uniref:glutathionylspermidine synthase family protein n=1 Tax=Bradyrhizobium sp. SZCCHNS3002 TaxID=3057310 RepID=UPI0028E8408E|nr:glutathionylspermidine synthase family protein [Bradyrhizobium sp. SZCCHNS3002]
MQRISCPERDDWRETAARCGFDFCELDGERYWDERAYYAFTIAEIELGIEEPTAELEQMCLALVARVVGDEALLRRLKIPQAVWPLLAESWRRRDGSLYGRFDLSYQGGRTPAKLLEYNADTPTSIFEAAVFQWTWLEQAIERRILPGRADQYNSIHERLIERWCAIGKRRRVHLAGLTANAEDATTLAYLADTAAQGGLTTTILDVANIGWRETGGFVDLDDEDIALAFKLYPWEWMFRDAFGAKLAQAPTQWIEPPWKAILSNKGILPLLWQMHEGHPNLLPAYFEDDPKAASLGPSFVRKPIYSREGANVSLVSDGVAVSAQDGPYGAEGFIRQALAPLPDFGGVFPVIGSWLVDHQPCGLSIREDTSPITGNRSRFLPHAIL